MIAQQFSDWMCCFVAVFLKPSDTFNVICSTELEITVSFGCKFPFSFCRQAIAIIGECLSDGTSKKIHMFIKWRGLARKDFF